MRLKGFWNYENRMILVLTVTFGFVFFDRNAFGYLAPFIRPELGLSNTQVGLIASVLSLAWALSALAVGAFFKPAGRRKITLITMVVIFSLCSVLSGLATSFLFLFLARMLMGFSEGGFLPIAHSLVALESHEKRRGLNMGVMQNLGSNLLGSWAAPLVLVAVAELFSWRVSFFLAAVPGLIMAVFLWLAVREPETDEEAEAQVDEGSVLPDRMSMMAMLKYRNVWLCMIISCFMVAWMVLGWNFLPLYYAEIRGMDEANWSFLMSLLGLSAALGAFVVPGLSDRLGRKPIMIGFCFLGLLVPLSVLYYEGAFAVLAVLIFVGWLASGAFPVFMATIPSETIPLKYLVTSMGLVMGTGELIGGVLSPTGAGWAGDVFGLQAPVVIMGGCAAVGGFLSLFLKETAPVKVGTGTAASA